LLYAIQIDTGGTTCIQFLGGKKPQSPLVAFLDDATRYVVYAGFYPTLDQIIVERALRQAITGYGVPEAIYFDRGSQYTTKQMHRICTKLGIHLLYAKPYSPKSKDYGELPVMESRSSKPLPIYSALKI